MKRGLKKDPLAGAEKLLDTIAIEKREKASAEAAAAKCTHPHLAFSQYGAKLQCIDCKRRWHTSIPNFDIPDYMYGNPSIPEGETRHSRYEPQRTEPKKSSIK